MVCFDSINFTWRGASACTDEDELGTCRLCLRDEKFIKLGAAVSSSLSLLVNLVDLGLAMLAAFPFFAALALTVLIWKLGEDRGAPPRAAIAEALKGLGKDDDRPASLDEVLGAPDDEGNDGNSSFRVSLRG